MADSNAVIKPKSFKLEIEDMEGKRFIFNSETPDLLKVEIDLEPVLKNDELDLPNIDRLLLSDKIDHWLLTCKMNLNRYYLRVVDSVENKG